DGSAVTVNGGATWNLDGKIETIGSLAGGGNVLLGAAPLTTGGDGSSTTFSGSLAGSSYLRKRGAGMMTLSGVNSHSGGARIEQGVLTVAGSGTLGSGDLQISSGAALQLGDGGGPLAAMVAGNIANNGQVVYATASDHSYDGEISGSGSLVHHNSASGTLTLTGANSYAGGTAVNGGRLLVNNAAGSGTGSGDVVVNAGTLGGAGTIGGHV
ncbi:MAG TPA: autotransporter-associated beta strand repeat-containing protein, partial [Lacipirellulaceae bacterium]|nr:autotransporter-associated beta strand repeat-containing protein [Lacipirellulaceae bacterium]